MKNITIDAPDWFSRSAIYQINPRTFSKEGTISAVTKELEYIKSLGFDIAYLCPIFKEDDSTDKECWSKRQMASETGNPKNPYRMNDYFSIDEEYGTFEDLKDFTAEAHRLGMRVILDLVYAHIGPNASIIQRHPEFVKQTPEGKMIYTEWNFPALDFDCPGLREYLYCNMAYFIGVIDADGFRCDASDFVPNDFWLEASLRIKRIKSDVVLINEGDKYERLKTAFECSYCYPWHEALYKVYCGDETVAHLKEEDKKTREKLPQGGLLIRDIDNHDTVTDWPKRTESVIGADGMEQIEVMNYIMDGIPMVYCGNEIADTAYLSMFANRFYPGKFEVTDRSKKDTPQAIRRQEVFKILNKLKKENDILRYGKTEWIENSEGDTIISFKRSFNDKIITFIGNSTDKSVKVEVENVSEKVISDGEILISNIKADTVDIKSSGVIKENKLCLDAFEYLVFEV